MNHSAKIVSAIFYEHALAPILAVSAILAVSVARANIADTKIIGIDTQWDFWYDL
jgi:hypothetical protein